jgi:subtilase family serine protease
MSANRGSTTMRNFPDVAMAAENFVFVANGSTSTGGWGTSFASPLWAGFVALVNQEAAANGQPGVGFLNPALYALGTSADYTNSFNDMTVGSNATATSGGLYPAVPGYDLCTGWGSPKGSNLIHSLALPQRLVIAPNSA